MSTIPIVDVSALAPGDDRAATRAAGEIGRACRDHGFFYATGHGVDPELLARLEAASRAFFAEPLERKRAIAMAHGGRAWRGYFAVGDELTSGLPDQKEGLYFGAELPTDHPKVRAGVPLHGPNLFPDVPGMRAAVLETVDAVTALGHVLMEGIALSLGLERSYFADRYTRDPLVLFRIFNYPSLPASPRSNGTNADGPPWSVGEHTDYGLLTMLHQDEAGGLQVKTSTGWLAAPPVPGTFVCNIGDMLDRMTGGRYRSTPHRVKNASGRDRLSFPLFFDPNFDARVEPIDPTAPVAEDAARRWDGASVHAFEGTYGDYLLRKVSKVFPELQRQVL